MRRFIIHLFVFFISMLILATSSLISIRDSLVNAQEPKVTGFQGEELKIRSEIRGDTKVEEEMRATIRANTATTTRDRDAIICSQVIPMENDANFTCA